MYYPKDVAENKRFRANMLQGAEKDKGLQAALKDACLRDRLFFFNVFAWTYDPRVMDKDLPFITYPFQDEVILWDADCAERQVDNLVEKSRDMGGSWMFIGNDFYDWLYYTERIETRWGSRKEQYVDTPGDMDSIFEKFRYLYKHLPKWMWPKGFNSHEHDNRMRLINPETGSSITGEATNNNFGRGGRKYRIRFDEFAFWECDNEAWEGCSDATKCRTSLSTPSGSSNKFAQLSNGKERVKEHRTLHWTLHPKKAKGAYLLWGGQQISLDSSKEANEAWQKYKDRQAPPPLRGGVVRSPWYDAECERRNVAGIAQELDIDYLKSGYPFFDMAALQKQRVWTYFQRKLLSDPIPHGSFIRAKLIDVDNKIELREIPNEWLKIYELPMPGQQYSLGIDVAEGLMKGDESFGVVRDKQTRNVVAVFNGLYEPDDVAVKGQKVGRYYNKAEVAPENNNHGFSVCSDLKQMDCKLYYTQKISDDGKVSPPKAGWTTTAESRPKMLDQLEEEIRKEAVELRDEDIIDQTKTFVKNEKNGKPEADGDFLDDGILATAICGAVIQERPYKVKPDRSGTEVATTSPNAGMKFGKK